MDTQNPFDDENQPFFVLTNQAKQLSLWPQHIDIPRGWQVIFGPKQRQSCIEYVEQQAQ